MAPSFTTTRPLNFAVLREKWLSGGKAADAVKPSQTEVGVITGTWWLLIPCEEVNRAGVAETVTPAWKKQLILDKVDMDRILLQFLATKTILLCYFSFVSFSFHLTVAPLLPNATNYFFLFLHANTLSYHD